MTQKKQIAIINQKTDLCLKAVSIIPLFVAAANDKKGKQLWKDAMKQWEEIEKEYKEILKYENNDDTTSIKT